MKLIEFSSRIETIEKSKLLDSIQETKNRFESVNDPVRELNLTGNTFAGMLDALDMGTLKKELSKGMTKDLEVRFDYFLTGSLTLLETCYQEIKKSKSNVLDGATVNIKEANIMLLVSVLDNCVDYLTRLMGYGLTALIEKKTPKIFKEDKDYFNSNLIMFSETVADVAVNCGIILKRIPLLPTIPCTEDNISVLEQSKGVGSVNLISRNNINPHNFNPYYWYKNVKLGLDIRKIKNHSERIQSLSLKIEQLQAGVRNPATDLMISKLEDKIIKSQDEIERIQRSYDYNG